MRRLDGRKGSYSNRSMPMGNVQVHDPAASFLLSNLARSGNAGIEQNPRANFCRAYAPFDAPASRPCGQSSLSRQGSRKRGNHPQFRFAYSTVESGRGVAPWHITVHEIMNVNHWIETRFSGKEAHFAELAWGSSKSRLMVEQMEDFLHGGEADDEPRFGWRGYVGNIRVMVEDVDSLYQVALQTKGAIILKNLENRYYGLRDFTVGGPFGIALRFASPLPGFDVS